MNAEGLEGVPVCNVDESKEHLFYLLDINFIWHMPYTRVL